MTFLPHYTGRHDACHRGILWSLPAGRPAWSAYNHSRPSALTGTGDLDAVADQDVPAVDTQRLGQQAKHQRGPQRGELVELDGGGVEIIAERIVATRIEVQRAHDGGDTELLGAHREAGHGGGEPQEGLQAGERRAQRPDGIPPEYPQ